MTIASTERHQHLSSLLAIGELTLPHVHEDPQIDLPPDLHAFRPPQAETLTVYRGDHLTTEHQGHFPRLWSNHGKFPDVPFEDFVLGGKDHAERLDAYWELAKAGLYPEACREMASQLTSGSPDFLNWVVDQHTDSAAWSPFISTTFNRELAASFAPQHWKMSVFECSVSPSRCIIDAFNIGGCGSSGELLVLGCILPSSSTKVGFGDGRDT